MNIINEDIKDIITKTGIAEYDEQVELTKGHIYYALTAKKEERLWHGLKLAENAISDFNKKVLLIHKRTPSSEVVSIENEYITLGPIQLSRLVLENNEGTLEETFTKIWDFENFHFDLIVLDISEYNGHQKREIVTELLPLVHNFKGEGFLLVLTDQVSDRWLIDINKNQKEIMARPTIHTSVYKAATYSNVIFTSKQTKEKLLYISKSFHGGTEVKNPIIKI